MIKSLISFALLTLLVHFSIQAQDTSYTKEWLEIDTLYWKSSLPQSALTKVNALYTRADKANQPDQLLKALMYRLVLERRFKEANINAEIDLLVAERNKTSNVAAKAILATLIADKYSSFLQSQRWRIYNRSKTENFKKEDILTWTIDDLHQVIGKWHATSLENAGALQAIPIGQFEAILNQYSENFFRPTLYDLLAQRALTFYKSDESSITKPADQFTIMDTAALGHIPIFVTHQFKTKDSTSFKWHALILYHDLLQFHLQRKDTAALIDVDIDRIKFVKQHGIFSAKDKLYLSALKEITQRYESNRFAAQAWFLLAEYYASRAGMYRPLTDTANRFDYLQSLAIIKRFLPLTDSTQGHNNLFKLHQNIIAKQLTTKTEGVVVPGKPIKTLVEYKNVDTLYYRIIEAKGAVEDSLQSVAMYNRGNKTVFSIAQQLPYLRQQKQALPATNDYQKHSVEIKIDELPAGSYYLLSSSAQSFVESSKLAWQKFTVSNISYTNNELDHFVLDRTTGQPLPGARVTARETYWNNTSRQNDTSISTYTTNKNGYLKLNAAKKYSRNILLDVLYKNDRLADTEPQYFSTQTNDSDEEEDEDYEADNTKAFFSLDRSIYRPGQTVFFKILVMTKDRKTKTPKLITTLKTKDSVFVFLKDVNDRELDSMLVFTNEYGSFAGKFVLPQNALTGAFSLQLETDDDDFQHEFSVEEYKRPTFSVDLKKPTGTYKLGDSVAVTIQAKAYAGNATDGATVKYTVTRNGRFLYPWMWWRGYRPTSRETIIATGEAVTDAMGNFIVLFEAEADEEISKDNMPVFDFEVQADVTDKSGETRSGTTTISVAYHSLNLSLNVAATAEADKLKNLFVTTTNLAGDKQPAVVQVAIYPLQSPAQPIKKSYWEQPDQFIYSKAEFKRYFPQDEYNNENDPYRWKKGATIFTAVINTKDSGKFVIPSGKLTSGWYLVEATTKDKVGNEIKDARYVQIYSSKAGVFNSNNYLFTSTVNNVATEATQATFLIGSPAKNVFLIQQVQKKSGKKNATTQSEFIYHNINQQVKTISILPKANDNKPMNVNFVFVKDNRCYTWSQRIVQEKAEQPLDIEVITYRNKLEPGSNETWSVKIKGANKEAAIAEVLTSMYDASLDQFKPHQWTGPSFPSHYYGFSQFNTARNFRTGASYENYTYAATRNNYFQYPEIDLNLRDALRKSLKRNKIRYESFFVEEEYDKVYQRRSLAGSVAGLNVSSRLDEVVVTGMPGSTTSVTIRGTSSLTGSNNPLVIVDGKVVANMSEVNPDDISNVEVLKNAEATALYGARGANGVVIVTTKNGALKEKEAAPLKVRTYFNETAFFLPQLRTDDSGNLSFNFTLPEALTQWKWQMMAHDKNARLGMLQRTVVSQKTLMVQMNAPRFLREGDKVTLAAKISNLSTDALSGNASLQLVDAVTGAAIDASFQNKTANKKFIVEANQSTVVQFDITVPIGFTNPVTWRVIAKAATYSDGEENTIPVLSNRMLVTESLPLFTRGNGTKQFQFKNLLNSNSTTLQHESLTIEYTSNPIWNVVQALPYLMEYPYECSEQTFNRIYANALAASIVKSHPRIQQVFNEWMKDSTALLSNLQKNQELKSLLLQETPWVLQAKSEAQQRKNVALLFQVLKLSTEIKKNVEKLKQMQMASGGFAWFKGGNEDRHITQYILTNIGRLKKLDAIPSEVAADLESITSNALKYADKELANDYSRLNEKTDLKTNNLSAIQLQYLYMRSYFKTDKKAPEHDYYLSLAKTYWPQQGFYFKAMIASVLYRDNQQAFVTGKIIPSLFENAVMDADSAMYWKDNVRGYYWYQAPVAQQVLMIELVDEVAKTTAVKEYTNRLDDMKTWLMKQKQTTHWDNTKATADACYSLISTGTNLMNANRQVTINTGTLVTSSSASKTEAGSSYLKQTIEGKKVNAAMGNISVTTTSNVQETTPSWGAVYWQYFEQLDKIPAASESPFTINKKLFKETNTASGAVLQPVNDGQQLLAGDKIKVRIELRSDRNLEYIHLKDMRAAGMEPVNVLSGYKWQDGLGYYESTRDASTNFFISYMPKGTYVFEYTLFVTHGGNFSVGIATALCMYAPSFSSHSEGIKVQVKNVE